MTPNADADQDATVLIRVQYFTRRAQAVGRRDLEIVRGGEDFQVVVHIASTDHPGVDGKVLFITATSVVTPPTKVWSAMRKLANGSGLPDSITDYGTGVSVEIATRMQRTFELVRWRSNANLSNHPFEYVGAEFSVDDGTTWLRLPLKPQATLRKPAALLFDSEAASSLQALAMAAWDEPVAHHLLREAFDVARANPRSAIVIGVAAVEAGFKHLVQELVPASAWLVEKMPSPPVTKMLAEFMPTLPAVKAFAGVVHPPPKYARKLMADAVEERNRVAHTGGFTMDPKVLSDTLECFRDLLYLFDFYAGHAWAVEHLSRKFCENLGS